MILLSVDESYDAGKVKSRTEKQAEKIYDKLKLDWPNVWVPGGWNEIARRFNVRGYGKILIGPDGVVRGVNVHDRDLDGLLKKLIGDPPAATSQPAAQPLKP